MKVKDVLLNRVNRISSAFNSLAQEQNGETESFETIDEKIIALSRQTAAEGTILLKNNGVAYPT